MTMFSVQPAGPPSVSRKMIVNARPNVQIVINSVSMMLTLRRPGSVMYQKLCSAPAPSTFAAS